MVVVALVLVLSSGGSSAGKQSAGKTTSTSARARSHSDRGGSSAPAASPAATTVAVLNGTSTNGLAHSLAKSLQQSGYSQATALNGTPPGSHAVTVVEYTTGHRADGEGVASALAVTQVQPLETPVAALASSATVVVIVGADKAAAFDAGGGGETSG